MQILNKIVARRTQLSDSGRKIADWIGQNPEKAAAMTSQKLAAEANVSQSSIVKFTQRIGFRGYSDFKLALNEELGRKHAMNTTPLHSNILADDPVAVMAQKLVKAKTDAIFNTTNALSTETCNDAISLLRQSNRVQVIGLGASALVAKDFSYKLLKLGITALTEFDSHVQIAVAQTLREQDMLFVISFSGDRKEVLVAAEAAKQQGAKVVALTSPGKSRLRDIADLCIDTVADESGYRSSSIASRTAQNVVTDLLFIALVQQGEQPARELIQDISANINQLF